MDGRNIVCDVRHTEGRAKDKIRQRRLLVVAEGKEPEGHDAVPFLFSPSDLLVHAWVQPDHPGQPENLK